MSYEGIELPTTNPVVERRTTELNPTDVNIR